MIITLPRNVKVDTNDIPDNLYEIVQKAFGEYTDGTAPAYTHQDKLMFIDLIAKKLHHADECDRVNELIKDSFAYQLDECGDFMSKSDFLSIEFMQECYSLGQKDHDLYSHDFANDRHTNENIMKIEAIAIKAVMNWEAKE